MKNLLQSNLSKSDIELIIRTEEGKRSYWEANYSRKCITSTEELMGLQEGIQLKIETENLTTYPSKREVDLGRNMEKGLFGCSNPGD